MESLMNFIKFIDGIIPVEYLSISITFISGLLAAYGETWVNRKLTKLGRWIVILLITGGLLKIGDVYRMGRVADQGNDIANQVLLGPLNRMGKQIDEILKMDSIHIRESISFTNEHYAIRNDLQHYTTRYRSRLKAKAIIAIEQFLIVTEQIANEYKKPDPATENLLTTYKIEVLKAITVLEEYVENQEN